MLIGMDYHDLPACMVQHDAYRPVDWRWQRARHWARRTDRRGWKDEDAWTQEAAITLRQRPWWFRPSQSFAARLQRIDAAHALAQASTAATVLRHAWLLAGLSLADTAERMHQPVEIVDWYERLFFDVRDRLHVELAMMSVAVGQQPPPGRGRVAWLLRWLAYAGGPAVLDAGIPVLLPMLEGRGSDPDHPPPLYEQVTRLLMDWNPPFSPALVEALRPLQGTTASPAPLGTDWRATSTSRLCAAFAREVSPLSKAGHFRTA